MFWAEGAVTGQTDGKGAAWTCREAQMERESLRGHWAKTAPKTSFQHSHRNTESDVMCNTFRIYAFTHRKISGDRGI